MITTLCFLNIHADGNNLKQLTSTKCGFGKLCHVFFYLQMKRSNQYLIWSQGFNRKAFITMILIYWNKCKPITVNQVESHYANLYTPA